MTLPVYPGSDKLRGLAYSSKATPQFFGQNFKMAGGGMLNLLVSQYPLWGFELTYQFLRDGPRWGSPLAALELRTMEGFFLQLGGSAGRFLYRNPDDYQVWHDQIATGDGTTTSFTITRTLGANGYSGTEPVGQIDLAAGINVYLGTSAIPVDPALYSIDASMPGANTITFGSAPSNSQAISIDMSFFYYCQFSADELTFEKFMANLWSLGKVSLQSCRPGT